MLMMNILTTREFAIIKLRQGIGTYHHSLQEVAKKYGGTRERIRQIESRAMHKLYDNYWNMYCLVQLLY